METKGTKMTKEQLIDRVLDQIAHDVRIRDFTAIAELLEHVPENILEGYLPEDA
jgi:hypothetical protein